MNKKIPKTTFKLILTSDAKKGLIVKEIIPETINPFSKPVHLTKAKKSLKDEVISFNIAGTEHYVTTPDQIKRLRKLGGLLCEARVVHEWKNKVDPFACAIYVKKIKLGYIPKDINKDFINRARKRITYKFYVCDLMTYIFEENFYTGPIVVAVKL